MSGVGMDVSGCPGARTSLFDETDFVTSSFEPLGASAGLLLLFCLCVHWCVPMAQVRSMALGMLPHVVKFACIRFSVAAFISDDALSSSSFRVLQFLLFCWCVFWSVGKMAKSRTSASRPTVLRLLLVLVCMHSASAVCPHCKDTIAGCAGGDRCPTISDIAANAKVIADRTVTGMLKVNALVPAEVAAHFPRGLVVLSMQSSVWFVLRQQVRRSILRRLRSLATAQYQLLGRSWHCVRSRQRLQLRSQSCRVHWIL